VRPAVHQFTEDAEKLLARFAVATVQDRHVDRARRNAGLGFFAALAVGVVLLFWLPALAALLGVVAVVCAVLWFRWKGRDIENRKLETVLKLLRILRADIPRDKPIALTVDLRGYAAGGEPTPRTWARFRRPPIVHYRHRWLQLRCRLADGNVVRIGVTDVVKSKQKRKKTVVTWGGDLSLAIRLAPQYAPRAAEIGEALHAGPAKSVGVRVVSARTRRARRGRDVEPWVVARLRAPRAGAPAVNADTVLGVLRWAYAAIAGARSRRR
jgi:hypothetical protein